MSEEMQVMEFSDEFLIAVGAATSARNSLEQPIDAICATLHHRGRGHRLSRRLPFHFQDKIDFLGGCGQRLPELHELAEDFDLLLPRAKALAITRYRIRARC